MARLTLTGDIATVGLTTDPEDGQIVATCAAHDLEGVRSEYMRCPWTERYDDLGDAVEYAADHADRGTA